ncbi:MAG: sulfur oxidation c-type cytochrome SoxX [Pseudomonadota bacterium]
MRIWVAAAAAAAISTSVWAGVIAPKDVAFQDGTIPQSLTGVAGDPVKGKDWFVGRKLGNCLACHVNSDATEESFHGEVGPPLDGVADRWTEAELRGILVNSKVVFEGTIMPAFYKDSGYNRNNKKFEGKTILEAQQVEDVIAYLMTLKE